MMINFLRKKTHAKGNRTYCPLTLYLAMMVAATVFFHFRRRHGLHCLGQYTEGPEDPTTVRSRGGGRVPVLLKLDGSRPNAFEERKGSFFLALLTRARIAEWSVLASFTTISAPQSPSRHRNQTARTTEKKKKPGEKTGAPAGCLLEPVLLCSLATSIRV
ncbi:FAD-binding monooxygenase moxY [Fusarium oxysporum f. sp. albedinis]|nr:FAD-binding monooxygenase moxY [Fusarium oxysporum f. sp. albedinis]